MTAVTMTLAAVLILLGLATATAQSISGVSCDDVRRLSRAEQDYWSARLNLSGEQRHRIYVACYVNYRGHETVAAAGR
jgi:hypothetical protein